MGRHTIICSYAERKHILQLYAASPRAAQLAVVDVLTASPECILPNDVLKELADDFANSIIEPVAYDDVVGVWTSSDVIGGRLVDLDIIAVGELPRNA